ncbi:hypothetical protein GCM10010156_25770 [Planobispora rosea]|uniref:Uncharacterized protein n=1 Tax=Planobispora rosea TaxID=35762 RepID=A0A8J3S0U0_PLARO|nr:hypothetical protein [Planobispora rosea]GGS65682.1 hypothetical protein GCM10010156_25770 [Planobispora rosea]GIH84938.1 hypothetical protein Pro02_33460 [Planobispora rosea]
MHVVVSAETGRDDQLRDLYAWLQEETDLRGRVVMEERPPDPGTLGPGTGALQVLLESGGALASMSAAVVSWLRTRTGEVSVKIVDGDKEMEATAGGLRDLDHARVDEITEQVVQTFQRVDSRG